MTRTIISLDDLPCFSDFPFDGRSDVPVHEIAVLTFKEIPQSDPLYSMQKPLYIVGVSKGGETIYFAHDAMFRQNASEPLMAVHSNTGQAKVQDLRNYQVLVDNDSIVNSKGCYYDLAPQLVRIARE